MSGGSKQKESLSERRLGAIGRLQYSFYRGELKPFQDRLVENAKKDHTALFRSRANADASVTNAGQGKAAAALAAGRSVAPTAELARGAADVAATALKAASMTGRTMRDQAAMSGLATRLGTNAEASKSLRAAASDSFNEAAQRQKIALSRQSDLLSAGGALAGRHAANTEYEKFSKMSDAEKAKYLEKADFMRYFNPF